MRGRPCPAGNAQSYPGFDGVRGLTRDPTVRDFVRAPVLIGPTLVIALTLLLSRQASKRFKNAHDCVSLDSIYF